MFHYTTAAGLLGILQSQSLWATDQRFLNDAQEASYGRGELVEAVRLMANPVLDPTHWAYSSGADAAKAFDYYGSAVVDALISPVVGVYVSCFCGSGDLLSQWRGYGNDHGYAIEPRVDEMLEGLDAVDGYPGATALMRVRYGTDAAADVVRTALDSVADYNLNHPGAKAHFKGLELNARLAGIKNPAFAEEREWRLVTGLDTYERDDQRGILCRATPMATIVPYIALRFSGEAVVSVRVGPGPYADVRQAGLGRLLSSVGSNAQVVPTEVALRG